MNYENFNRVLSKVEANPELWNQSFWRPGIVCGTACCIAGHAAIESGKDPVGMDSSEIRANAREFFDVEYQAGDWLFDWERSLDDFRRLRWALATSRLIAVAA